MSSQLEPNFEYYDGVDMYCDECYEGVDMCCDLYLLSLMQDDTRQLMPGQPQRFGQSQGKSKRHKL